ncbi:MAG: TetR family transcriptional regulator [Gracilibacter sp. BRH_c7a]|nr:MAG: TetR family transcriptional regulator [Gracilibacter sp. BRH_c7a]
MAKEDKRIDILRAASRVFYLRGFEGTKIDDIAKEAGIGKGTVYEYYHSKQELFDKAVSYNREQYIEQVKATLSQDGTLRDKFIAFAKYQTELVKTHIPIFNMMCTSKIIAREMGALMLEQNIRVAEILTGLVKKAVDQGELREDINPEMAAAVMIGTINQYSSKKVIFFDAQPEDIDYEQMADIIFKGIG